jgi:hypothetical protein
VQIDKVRDFGTCGERAFYELIAERRKQAMIELGEMFDRAWGRAWASSR